MVTRVLDMADTLELIVNSLNERPLVQEQVVRKGHGTLRVYLRSLG
jgi:hypothetical protein